MLARRLPDHLLPDHLGGEPVGAQQHLERDPHLGLLCPGPPQPGQLRRLDPGAVVELAEQCLEALAAGGHHRPEVRGAAER